MAVAWANCLLQRTDAAQVALDHLAAPCRSAGEHEEMHSEADVVQACIDVYCDRTDRAEAWSAGAWSGPGPTVPGWSRLRRTSRRSATSTRCVSRKPGTGSAGPDRSTNGPSDRSPASTGDASPGSPPSPSSTCPPPRSTCTARCVLARESAGRRSHAAQLAGALLGELHYERGELDEAERLLEESGELGAESGVVDFMVASYALLARIKADRGAMAEAAELLAEGAKVAERLGLARLRAAVLAERIRQLLARGECARPAGWRKTCRMDRAATAGSA